MKGHIKYYPRPQTGYLSIESEQAVEAACRLCALIGREAYDEFLKENNLLDEFNGPPDYKPLRDLANAEYVRLTECTCRPDSVNACPACTFALEQGAAVDEFPY